MTSPHRPHWSVEVYRGPLRKPAIWDLNAQMITVRGDDVPMWDVLRVITCSGARGYLGILLFGWEGQFSRLTVPIRSRTKPSLAAWQAIRHLLALPHQPTLEGYATPFFSAAEFNKRPPRSTTRGSGAVAVLDAQIAWISEGHNPRSGSAPLERFRLSGMRQAPQP